MKNLLFVIIGSFIPLTLMDLFSQNDTSQAQLPTGQPQGGPPQMGGPQRGASSGEGLESHALPTGPITEDDMSQIETAIGQELNAISESMKTDGGRVDCETIKSGILDFLDWLNRQGCIIRASASYDVEATDKYSENIFVTYPGQLPFDIVFNMKGGIKKQYRLLIFVSTVDFFRFANLMENNSVFGFPDIEN